MTHNYKTNLQQNLRIDLHPRPHRRGPMRRQQRRQRRRVRGEAAGENGDTHPKRRKRRWGYLMRGMGDTHDSHRDTVCVDARCKACCEL